ncbi:MAG: glycosyltransferase family 4 protein [Anaerolineales bacterium]
MARFMRSNDVVFFEWASELLAMATSMPKVTGIVTRLHRYELYQWADQIRWESVDRLIVVSESKKDEFTARYPDVGHKIEVIPEAIAPSDFAPQEKHFEGNLGILCHLSPRKRVYDLILAFSELATADETYSLHIGGGPHSRYPEYLPVLESLVERLGIRDRVEFYGPIADPRAWYAKIDIFISNSYSEGLQVSPMEAMAAGCYCLSHNWAGADELLPEDQLFFSEREMIEKVRRYADMAPDQRVALRARLRNSVLTRFDIDRIGPLIQGVLEDVASLQMRAG